MSLEIPITIATVIAVTYGERGASVPAYVDSIENFIFIGEPTLVDRDDVLQCAYETVVDRTDQLEDEEIYDALHDTTFANNQHVEFRDGNVSVHWETRL